MNEAYRGTPETASDVSPKQGLGGPSERQAAVQFASIDRCLEEELLRFGIATWKVQDAVEGTQVFGGTGSGKTSGSGRAIARSFIQKGFGGLVLTAKPDDLDQWVRYLRAAGLNDDQIQAEVVVVEPPGTPHPGIIEPKKMGSDEPLKLRKCHSFNFLEHEYGASGLTHDVVSLFLNTMSVGGAAVSSSEPYWDEALRELLTHAVDLVVLGTRGPSGKRPELRLEDLMAVVRTAPQSIAEASSLTWRASSRCWELLEGARGWAENAVRSEVEEGRLHDLADTVDYWMQSFPALSDRTRSIIVSSFTAKVATLLRHPLRELLCGRGGGQSIASPEATHRGTVVILNLPVKLYGEVGRFAQTIWKTVWQRATDRRARTLRENWSSSRPVFLWADESQYFLTREDAQFQQTARSSLAATVFLTQNISNYYTVLGGSSGKAATDSLLGNLQTKIFHANGDPATNHWAEEFFSKHWRAIASKSGSQGMTLGRDSSINIGGGQQDSVQLVPVVEARAFLLLATGSARNKHQVEAIIGKPGRRWAGRDSHGYSLKEDASSDGPKDVAVLRHVFQQQGD